MTKYSQPEIFGCIHHSRKLISGYSGMFMIYPIMPFVQIYHGGFQIFGGQPQPSIIVNNAIYDGYKSLMFPHIVVQPVGNMYNPLLDGWMIKKNKLILIGEIPNAPILRVPNIPVCDVCIPRCKHHLRIYPSIYSHHKFSQLTRITSIVWILVTIPGTYHSAILNITVKNVYTQK